MEQKFQYQLLNWDSDFLDFPVAAININTDTEVNFESLFEHLKMDQIKLLYLYSEQDISASLKRTGQDFLLADDKVTFQKKITAIKNCSIETSYYDKDIVSEQLLHLTYQSGIYSRFFIDKHFDEAVFKRLYKIWIEKSVKHEIADEVIVYIENDAIKGFITVGEKNGIGDIGLVAVSEECRGKGIGKQLIVAADNWCFQHQYTTIQVVTQGVNIPAMNLYEQSGFNIVKRNFIYHIWF